MRLARRRRRVFKAAALRESGFTGLGLAHFDLAAARHDDLLDNGLGAVDSRPGSGEELKRNADAEVASENHR